ncbi:MAG: DNA primase [Gammaproteobacteria bacterium]|nr:DNA primase [Gammaproteobacteria bacterium]
MAGNIPRTFIDDLLTRIDIVDVIESRVPLKKAGKDYQACCPFHSEKTPSFTVSRQKQFYYCFGCGATGSAIRFLMDYDHMSFVEAVEDLAKTAGVEVPYEKRHGHQIERTKPSVNYYELMDKVARFYQYQLRQHSGRQAVVEYLKQRGLTGEIAKAFEIGFAPPGWNSLLSALPQARQHLVDMGLLVQKDDGKNYDRFRNRVMFPIRDRRGRVIAFGGRVINKEDSPKYLNSPETVIFQKSQELYGLYQVLKAPTSPKQVIVVEGYMDVVSLAQYGLDNAVATLGTAVSDQHIATLVKHFNEVVYCFDGDAAGRKAALRAMEASLPKVNSGVEFRFMFLPQGEDPDSVVKEGGSEAFKALVAQAMPLSRFLISELLEKADYRALDGQARLLELARPHLQKIPPGSYLTLISNELSKYVDLEGGQLLGEVSGKSGPQGGRATAAQKRPKEEKPSSVRSAIAMLLEEPQLAEKVENPEKLLTLNVSGVKFLVDLLVFIKGNPNITTGAILEHWHNTPQGKHLYKVLSWEHHVPESGFESEFIDSIGHLEQKLLDQELNELLALSNRGELSSEQKLRLSDLLALRR